MQKSNLTTKIINKYFKNIHEYEIKNCDLIEISQNIDKKESSLEAYCNIPVHEYGKRT